MSLSEHDSCFEFKKWIQMPEGWLCLIMLIGIPVRLLRLGDNPMGLHQDEAYSAYNAWAVMNYGIDSFGYIRPVYYTVWGSGMNVLYSYLTIPFFALFGVSVVTIRLPQAILGCLCIPAVYGLGKEMFQSRRTGVLFAFLLAVNPWHIQQSRFGLESGVAVPLLLFAIYFFCRYLNGKRKSLWGAVIFGGLTLYAYALTWLLIPLLSVLSLLFFYKRFVFRADFFLQMFLLFVMALPLLLFLAVNFDMIPEIRTGIISIPKLPALRTGEMTVPLHTWGVKRRVLSLINMLLRQYDDRWWISNATVGSYYYISTPFVLTGMLYHAGVFFQWVFRKRELPVHFLLALWFGAAFLVGCSVDLVYFHKVNYIHIPIILYGGVGVRCLCKALKKYEQGAAAVFTGIYMVCFGGFVYSQATYPVDYDTYGNPWVSHMNWYKYEKALEYAKLLTDGEISVIALNFANVMLYDKISPYDFMETVVYGGTAEFMDAQSFGRYRMGMAPPEEQDPMNPDPVVYVYPHTMGAHFEELGYTTVQADACYDVAYRSEVYGAGQ